MTLSESPDDFDTRVDSPEQLVSVLCSHAAGTGCHRELDADHSVTLIPRGRTLLVSFESVDDTLASPDGLPLGLDFVEAKDWSLLHFSAARATWFRSAAVYDYLDWLADNPILESFDRVLFYGAGMGGYAACAFSVVSPGATVVAVRPQATLDPRIAPWETRFITSRRRSFTDRYGYAPEMLDGAMRAFILFDPFERLDAMHAALFRAANVTLLRCPRFGPETELALREMDILHALIERAADDRLQEPAFARLLRARRRNAGYLRRLVQDLEAGGRDLMLARVCAHALRAGHGRYFRKRLRVANERLAEAGLSPVAPG